MYLPRDKVPLPEGMDAIYDSRHILSVVQVSGDWIKVLKKKKKKKKMC